MRQLIWVATAVLALAGAARAEVVDSQPDGFEVRHSAKNAAPASKLWAALGQPGAWWDSAHSWSGDATNITIELKPGGCWCEALPNGGGARHMEVIFVEPGRTVRLSGGLGPLSMT
jgi:hypothetical protein